jgi:hypothetical protein
VLAAPSARPCQQRAATFPPRHPPRPVRSPQCRRAAIIIGAAASLRRVHHRCCCGACSGWPLWLRRDRHRPGCRRRQARSAWPYQQCNLFQPLSGTAVQARSLPHADRLGELLGPRGRKHTVKRLFPLLSPDLPSGSGRPGRARREAAAPRGIQFINLINIHD